jgi:hypothetical protein
MSRRDTWLDRCAGRVRWLEPATNDPNSNVRKLIRWLSGAASDRSI